MIPLAIKFAVEARVGFKRMDRFLASAELPLPDRSLSPHGVGISITCVMRFIPWLC